MVSNDLEDALVVMADGAEVELLEDFRYRGRYPVRSKWETATKYMKKQDKQQAFLGN